MPGPGLGGRSMVVGVLQLTLFLPENHSLKGKRQVLRSIKDRVRNKFNVSIAESDGHDFWQRAELGICQVGSDRAFVDSALREGERVDKLDDLAQSRIDERAVTAHLAYPQLCALPEVVTIGLGDRDVELVANAILDRS